MGKKNLRAKRIKKAPLTLFFNFFYNFSSEALGAYTRKKGIYIVLSLEHYQSPHPMSST
jgi:hypothetical protein